MENWRPWKVLQGGQAKLMMMMMMMTMLVRSPLGFKRKFVVRVGRFCYLWGEFWGCFSTPNAEENKESH